MKEVFFYGDLRDDESPISRTELPSLSSPILNLLSNLSKVFLGLLFKYLNPGLVIDNCPVISPDTSLERLDSSSDIRSIFYFAPFIVVYFLLYLKLFYLEMT